MANLGLGRATAVLMLMASSALSPAAFAQSGADGAGQNVSGMVAPGGDEAGDIVVTGSRIASRDQTADSPIVTVPIKAFQVAGPANVESYINTLPQFAGDATSSSNNPSQRGKATLNLRGLGPNRTLVLLDGHRLLDSVPDVTVIPTGLIDNVEIITGGASAAYGSDAIGGVVNFKLKKNFSGLLVDAQQGVTQRGDGRSFKVGVVAGGSFAEDRGHAAIAFDYFDRGFAGTSGRPWSNRGVPTSIGPSGTYVPAAANLPAQSALNAVFGRYGVATGSVSPASSLLFNNDGSLYTATGGAFNYRGPQTAGEFTRGGQYFYNTDRFNAIQLPQKRYNVYGHADYDLTDDISAYGLFIYDQFTAYTSQVAAVSNGTGFSVPVTNPFIPQDLRTILASRPTPGASFALQKRFQDLGIRNVKYDSDFYLFGGGLKGKVPSIGWTWDLYASRSRMSVDSITLDTVSRSAVQTLLSAPDGGASLCSGGLNLFGTGTITPSCAAYIVHKTNSLEQNSLTQVELNVQGSLFRLPAGEVKLALGADYRRSGAVQLPDAQIASGDILGFGFPTTSNTIQTVKEVYGELLVPVLKDLPFAHELNIGAGYRYSKYSTLLKSINSYKVEGNWSPVRGVRVRGSYQRAVRAPSPLDLIQGAQQNVAFIGAPTATGSAGDPCDVRGSYRGGSAAASVSALCVAQGVPQALIGGYTYGGSQVTNIVGGNPSLREERADTYSVGLVLEPRFSSRLLQGLTASVDYYNINIKGSVGTIDANSALSKCFNFDGSNSSYSSASVYCRLIARDPANGNITQIVSTSQNLGSTKLSGVDFTMNWTVGLGDKFGRLNFNSLIGYLQHFKITNLPGGPTFDYADSIGNGVGTAHPRWKTNTSVTYSLDPFELMLQWQHISSMRDVSLVGAAATATATSASSVNYFDFTARVRLTPHVEMRFIVNNLTDKAPPLYSTPVQFNTDPSTYDTLGRRFTVGVRGQF